LILRVEEGRIVGLIGPNGAGKTTALNAISRATPYQGELKVLGRDPWTERDLLMRDVCFIADVAVLPRWIRVSQALDYVAGVHPRFDGERLKVFLHRHHPEHQQGQRIVERHGGPAASRSGNGHRREIARAGRADAWLDILFRKQFLRLPAERLLRSYAHDRGDHANQVENTGRPHRCDVHQPWPDRAQLQHGRIRVALCGSDGESRASRCRAGAQANARAPGIRAQILLFDRVDREQLAEQFSNLGEVRTPSIADLFVAVVGNQSGQAQGAAK